MIAAFKVVAILASSSGDGLNSCPLLKCGSLTSSSKSQNALAASVSIGGAPSSLTLPLVCVA